MADKRGPNPVDVHVGARIHVLRILREISQEQIATNLAVSHQQVQKYERGINRVSASSLFKISHILGVAPEYFFEAMPDAMSNAPLSGPRGRASVDLARGGLDDVGYLPQEVLEWVRAFYQIPDAIVQQKLLDILKSIGAR